MKERLSRVLIVSASIGGGHVAAARALEGACLERGVIAQHIDMLDYTTPPFRRLYRRSYFDLVRTAPDLVDWLGKRMDRLPSEQKSRQSRVRARLVRMISYRLPRLIHYYQPDVLIHTHFLPPEILSTLGQRRAVRQAVVVTDFAAHSLWLQRGMGRYFVASRDVAVHLNSAGVEEERIEVSGIPIDLRFAALPDKEAARAALGIASGRDVLLIMAGGLDKRPLLELMKQLRGFRWPLTVIIICGRSAALINSVNAAIYEGESDELIRFRVVGFTADVPSYMAAADLMVGKPGGLTSSEALAAGLPFAVVQPYPIQEEANANYLLEHGVGMRIEPLSLFGHKLRSFFEDNTRQQEMRAAAQRLAKPEAARQVIASLLEHPLTPPGQQGQVRVLR